MTSTSERTSSPKQRLGYRLARGPLLVTAVTISVLFPYLERFGWYLLQHQGSWHTFLQIALAVTGIVWCVHDFFKVTKEYIRSFCNKVLDGFVLDNVLQSVYDPETGWIACLTGMVVGSSTMYGLKMSPEQRVKLLQSSLPQQQQSNTATTSEESLAHKVLMEPGGCKLLLPETMQQWLMENDSTAASSSQKLSNKKKPHGMLPEYGDISVDDTHSTECFDMTEMEVEEQHHDDIIFDSETVQRARGLNFHQEETKNDSQTNLHDQKEQQQQQQQQQNKSTSASRSHEDTPQPTNPVSVFAAILKEMAMEQITPYAETFPRSKVENVGMTAIGIQLIMLFLSRRQRRRSTNKEQRRYVLLERICTMALSSIAAASFGSILTQEAILGKIYDRQSLQLACRGMVCRVLDKIKRKVLSHKARSFLAMAVLVMAGRKPKNNIGTHS